jgi:chemotaxis protein methyltransferase CheR
VLIYFALKPKRQVLANLKQRMAADGVLILGGAESTLGIDDEWQRVSHGKTSTYRVGLGPACSPTGH